LEKPNPAVTDNINVPPDILAVHHIITLDANIMFVGGITFLLTTSRNIHFTTVEKIDSKKENILGNGIIKVVNLYKRQVFLVHICVMDIGLEILRGPLLEKVIALNTCGPGKHVPEI
jgi:hypothetical protein